MNAEIKPLFVAALRSGEYPQGKGALCRIDDGGNRSYCCLGVLSDLYAKAHPEEAVEGGKAQWQAKLADQLGFGPEKDMGLPPRYVYDWAGLVVNDELTIRGWLAEPQNLNDGLGGPNKPLDWPAATFDEIATAIEEQW